MWRKFTVYGLRFSKTSFWNRINTGFLDSAVATAPTACGIETPVKLFFLDCYTILVATAPTACGIETIVNNTTCYSCRTLLQQHLPLAVLKHFWCTNTNVHLLFKLQQHLPLAVLKLDGIDLANMVAKLRCCNSTYRLRY